MFLIVSDPVIDGNGEFIPGVLVLTLDLKKNHQNVTSINNPLTGQ